MSEKKTICFPENGTLERVIAAARAAGQSPSKWVVQACLAQLDGNPHGGVAAQLTEAEEARAQRIARASGASIEDARIAVYAGRLA